MERADRAARAHDPRVEKVFVTLGESTKTVRIANSAGVLAEDVQPLFSMRVSVIAAEKGVRRDGTAGGGGRLGPEFFVTKPPEHFAREAARMAVTLLSAREAPAGEMPVVLGPGWPGILLHEAVGHGLEGDFNRKGTSAFTGRIGQRVAAPGVTVVDDGTIRDRRGSLNVDDEGRPPGRTVLIEDGILRGYLQDELNARLMKMPATGNGRRQGYACLPLPRMTNTFMLAGSDDPQDIIRSVKRGLYAPALRRRPGRHHERQVRLLGHRGLPHRGRPHRRARGGRHPDRQRPGRAHPGHAHRPRPEARRGHRHLRQGGPERAGGGGPAHHPGLGDHGGRHASLSANGPRPSGLGWA